MANRFAARFDTVYTAAGDSYQQQLLFPLDNVPGAAVQYQLRPQPTQLQHFQLPLPQPPSAMMTSTFEDTTPMYPVSGAHSSTDSTQKRPSCRFQSSPTAATPFFSLPVPARPSLMTKTVSMLHKTPTPTPSGQRRRRYHPYSSRQNNNSNISNITRKLQKRKDAKAFLDVLGYLLENGRPDNTSQLLEDICGGRSDQCYSSSGRSNSEVSQQRVCQVRLPSLTPTSTETVPEKPTITSPKKEASAVNPKPAAETQQPSRPEEIDTTDSTTWQLLPVTKDSELYKDSLMYWCRDCGQRFSSKQGVITHMSRNLHPFSCDECGKDFSKFSTFMTHMRRHRDRYIARCDTCDVKFYSKYSYRKHMRQHRNDN